MKRHKLSRGGSKSYFSNTAKKSHPYNHTSAPMRGGYRL